MRLWDRVVSALRREKHDVSDALDELETRANAALEQRERELYATAEERVAIEEERGRRIEADLDALRERIAREAGGRGGDDAD